MPERERDASSTNNSATRHPSQRIQIVIYSFVFSIHTMDGDIDKYMLERLRTNINEVLAGRK